MDIQFSVVIPLYNKEEYVAQTLKSVVGQTYQNFEVVIVNDCSSDNSVDVVKAIDDRRIKIIEQSENKGLSASRNTGINAATHPHIAFLDADDYWENTQTSLSLQPITEKITMINFLFQGQISQKTQRERCY